MAKLYMQGIVGGIILSQLIIAVMAYCHLLALKKAFGRGHAPVTIDIRLYNIIHAMFVTFLIKLNVISLVQAAESIIYNCSLSPVRLRLISFM